MAKPVCAGLLGFFTHILKAEDNLQFNGKPPFFASAGFEFHLCSQTPRPK